MSDEGLELFLEELDKTSKQADVDFIMIISRKKEMLPEKAKNYVI
jgi:hypothetical protein